MKATIEIGRKPQAFWICAIAMLNEHGHYYARENGFRANRAMFAGIVNAHNAGISQLAIEQSVRGCTPAVQSALNELDGTAPLAISVWGVIDRPITGGQPGADWALDGKAIEVTWTTSAGNSLTARLDDEWFTVMAEGRRHGIPWRFLQGTGITEDDLLVLGMESESTSKPWCDGNGEPLVQFNGQVTCDFAGVGVIPKPGIWPDWGDTHQQAGWVADKVCDAHTFENFCRTCAKFNVPGRAVRFHPGRSFGVFRMQFPKWEIRWADSPGLFRQWLAANWDCSRRIQTHDTAENWRKYCRVDYPPPKGDLIAAAWSRHREEIIREQRDYFLICESENYRVFRGYSMVEYYGETRLSELRRSFADLLPT